MSTVRYGRRFAERRTLGFIPTVELTLPQADYGEYRFKHTPVRRVHGFTEEHALIRAQRWARAHGDPR